MSTVGKAILSSTLPALACHIFWNDHGCASIVSRQNRKLGCGLGPVRDL